MAEKEKHEHHHVLIGFLLVAVVGLAVLVGLFGYRLFLSDTVRNVQRVEFDETDLDEHVEEQRDRVEESLEDVPFVEEELTPSTLTFVGSAVAPTFSYPATWHVFSSQTLSSQPGVVNTIFVDPEPIEILEETGARPGIISITTMDLAAYDLGTYPTYAAMLEDSLTNEFVIYFDMESRPYQGGTLTTFTGRQESGLGPDHDFEFAIYETATTVVSANFQDTIPGSEDNLVWEDMKPTFDLSTIQ